MANNMFNGNYIRLDQVEAALQDAKKDGDLHKNGGNLIATAKICT